MSNVYAVAIVNKEGEIESMYHPGAYVDPEGSYALDSGKNVVHLTETVDVATFMETRYWKQNEGWKARTKKTAHYYFWKDEKWNLNSTELWKEIRSQRDVLMFESDKYVLPDFPQAADKLAAWKTYRQALRDVPASNSSVTDITEVTWPTKAT